MHLSDHSELISVLTELWTLIDQLAVVKSDALRLPPSDSGIHSATSFHADAALAAGFTTEAVAVMSALPYLHDSEPGFGQRTIEIEGSTFPLSYLHYDENDFTYTREMFSDENIMPPSAFRLTWQDVNGWEFIYDTDKSRSYPHVATRCRDIADAFLFAELVYVWNPINDDGDDHLHLRPVPPRQAFQPLLDDFRGLHRVAVPEDRFVKIDEGSRPKLEYSRTQALYEASYNMWKATCGIADLYLECNWRMDAVTQTEFRASEFVDKRSKYIADVLEPLEEKLYKIMRPT